MVVSTPTRFRHDVCSPPLQRRGIIKSTSQETRTTSLTFHPNFGQEEIPKKVQRGEGSAAPRPRTGRAASGPAGSPRQASQASQTQEEVDRPGAHLVRGSGAAASLLSSLLASGMCQNEGSAGT